LEDRFGALPEPAQNLVYLTSLRLRAADAGVEQVAATDGEIVVRFDRLPPLDLDHLARTVGVPLKKGSNQVRLPRADGSAWMGSLYTLIDALPGRG
jgi:transcription-repair coupling factor (superfamily II helicase)